MTDNKKKKRAFKNRTPGQERDFEILSARRMFQAYEDKTDEDAPVNHTGPAIANFDPPLGKTKVYKRKRRELNMDTLQTDNRVDGRRKNYRETVRRIKERQERLKARDAARIKEPVLKPNPFGHAVAEVHSSKEGPEQRAQKDAAVAAWTKAGGVIKKLKPGQPKGMSKSRKAVVKMRKENAEMNKKYFDTRSDSLEAAAYQSANTEVPVNPNSLRPTLHLPKKYLETKEGSLERAVEEALTEAGATKKQVKMAKGIANDPRHKGGDMTGAWKKAEKIKKGLGDHAKVQKALRKANEEPESEWAKSKRIDREVSAKLIKTHDEREKRYQAQQAKQKQTREQAVDVINAIQFGKPFKIVDEQEIPSAELREKEVTENGDDRRTVDSIRAYDKSKDASRDADWDTVHGKIKQGKKEKKYAKKERGEIDKDDPHWKSRAYHTGMHGEEIKPLSQEMIDAVLSSPWIGEDKLSYKERQKLPTGDFALPGKGSGPEGKQGGSYPIPDESHARNALARVSQHGSEAEKAKVRKAVSSKYPNIKIGESKETEKGERDVGSDAYANYVAGLTPGQEPDSAITGKNAKKESSISKKNTDEKARLAGLEDEYVPTLEEYATHLESLDEDALETELETLSQNELLEILGTGLVKKAAGAIKKRFSVAGRTAAAKKKGDKIAAKTNLATQKTSNIAAKAGLKKAKAGLKAAKGPGVVKKAASAVGGAKKAKKVIGAAPKKPVKVKSVPGQGLVAAEYEPESLIAQAMDELSKK